MDLVAERFRAETTRLWVDRLAAAGVPCGPVQGFAEILEDPQLRSNGTFLSMTHEIAGAVRIVNFPFRLRDAPIGIARPAPTLGRDTAEILRGLGYDDPAIAALERFGVTAPSYLAEE